MREIPEILQTWEEKRLELTEKLLGILNEKLSESLLFINSFLFSGSFIDEFIGNLFEEFVSNESGLKEGLKRFSIKPVTKEICPLIAFSEWCRQRFLEDSDLTFADKIEDWQKEVMRYREGVNLNKIQEVAISSYNDFKKRIAEEDLRIQIQIAPEKDKNGTGLNAGTFLLNMDLWVQTKKSPLAPFAKKKLLQPQETEQEGSEEMSNSLQMCLEKEDFLLTLIRKARYSLPTAVKLKIEFFLPLDLYQCAWERISFKSGRGKKMLGEEYPIFINSYERYFEPIFFEICDEIQAKKKRLWETESHPDSELCYISTQPLSDSELEFIEEALPIAVWSRCQKILLTEGDDIKRAEWKDWPQKIHDLRKQRKDLEVTLFWDDLYPKPQRPRLLNTKVVE